MSASHLHISRLWSKRSTPPIIALYYATAAGQGIIDDVPSLNSKCSLYVNSHYVPHALRSTCKTPSIRTAVALATYVRGCKVRRSNPGRDKTLFTSPKRPRRLWHPSILPFVGTDILYPGGYSCCGVTFIIHRHVAPGLRWKSSGCNSIYQQLSLYILPSLFLLKYKDDDCIKNYTQLLKPTSSVSPKNLKQKLLNAVQIHDSINNV